MFEKVRLDTSDFQISQKLQSLLEIPKSNTNMNRKLRNENQYIFYKRRVIYKLKVLRRTYNYLLSNAIPKKIKTTL